MASSPSFIASVIRKTVLKDFFKIQLTSGEAELANDAVDIKYVKAVKHALIYVVLLFPSLLLLDTSIVISVLLPTTMVAGTAWFSVSLASIKAKFEDFGMELTTDLFVAFTLSLMMLFFATLSSLTEGFWRQEVAAFSEVSLVKEAAAFLATVVVGKLLFSIFSGSLKYDINDAMLTGQNEAAERFFKTSLSVLHNTSNVLKTGRSLHVANYSIGVAFFEVFTSIKNSNSRTNPKSVDKLIEKANELVKHPSMKETEANKITIELTDAFVSACANSVKRSEEHKSFVAIRDEILCLGASQSLLPKVEEEVRQYMEMDGADEDGSPLSPLAKKKLEDDVRKMILSRTAGAEDQEMTDLRISVILTEISTLIEEFGYEIVIK